MQTAKATIRDPNLQLRALYMTLLRNQERFDEFKHLLALYQPTNVRDDGNEEPSARAVRDRLNERIEAWLGMRIEALTPDQVLMWRTILVEDRFSRPSTWVPFAAP